MLFMNMIKPFSTQVATEIPTLELKGLIKPNLIIAIWQLVSSYEFVPCEDQIQEALVYHRLSMLERGFSRTFRKKIKSYRTTCG